LTEKASYYHQTTRKTKKTRREEEKTSMENWGSASSASESVVRKAGGPGDVSGDPVGGWGRGALRYIGGGGQMIERSEEM